MPHLHSVYDNDTHFKIDPVTRQIKNESGKVILMQNDHNSERFTFEISRYIDGHDMSLCNKVEVHFINLKGDKTEKNADVYTVEDLQISPNSDDVVICSWLISQNATKYAGSLNFVLRYACLTNDAIDYQWYTDIHKGITVSESISNTETVAVEYSDVLETWREELMQDGIIVSDERIAQAIENYFTEHPFDGSGSVTGGKDGISPIVSVSKSGKVTTITIKDAEGTKTATIRDGEDGTGGSGDSIPSYVRTEAERVAKAVQSRQNANTITFLACSDIHYNSPYNALPNTNAEYMHEAVVSMGQAMGLIREQVHIDFAVMLGDMIWDSGEASVDEILNEMRFVNACLHNGFSGIPQFRIEGNHDDGYESTHNPTAAQIYANIGAWNDGAVFGNREAGYCYRDFDSVKLRVICLNSSQHSGSGFMTSADQVAWLATALNLNNKGADWRSIILSHHPLEYDKAGGVNPIATINSATGLIASFHGHIHNFLIGTVAGTSLPRISIPNAGYSRENQYAAWKESTTYSKTPGTEKNTSFCVVTIDLAAKKIYADHYGAGYTRVLTFDEVELATYTVTNNLTNVRNSNESAVVNEGYAYSATLVADDGYELESVTVTMGGNPVTVNGGVINIPSVTGNIVITATAVKSATGGNYTNLVTTSTDPATGEVYNGVGNGYKNDVYGSGAGEGGTPDTTCVLTGLIAYGNGRSDPIYIKGADITTDSHCRILGFNELRQCYFQAAAGSAINTYFTVEKLGNQYYKVTPILSAIPSDAPMNYLRFSLIGEGENLIITIDEPIE